ncbi:hypothetical protein SRABI96_02119 [Peribacillus sp. Bi96]|uniref:hypothetical protein n=1 Tax=unclassified Peribacillus TaxID=2675266 RepID=UPI001DA4BBC3|nr:hypothetical protein [Peribacillus sp. Bi96]CAH0208837.1 hypothetical protein SRABI96_02119 [Peribacillus sp. Bi96]
MGYIAPVTQFDYIQYANRTIEAAEKVRIVNGTTPIQPIRFDQVLEERGSFEEFKQVQYHNRERRDGASTYKIQIGRKVHQEITAEMTGKGGYFNKIV